MIVNFSASSEKKPAEVNPKRVVSVDKENEIDKRRKELAKQKELREKQAKEDVRVFFFYFQKEVTFYFLYRRII